MARTVQEVLRDYLGDQVLTFVQLQAENERLRGEIVTLDNELRVYQDADPTKGKPKPNGKDPAGEPARRP